MPMDQIETLPEGVGTKFHPDGSVRRFAGNTFVSATGPGHPAHSALREVADRLAASEAGDRLALLPPSSYHMTVFEGINDQVRAVDRWPVELPLDATLDEANAFFADRLAGFEAGDVGPFRLGATGLHVGDVGIYIALEPRDDVENGRLRGLRDRLRDRLGFSKPGHETYRFHISLAYWIRHPRPSPTWDMQRAGLDELTRRLLPEIEVPAPDFCHFDDMFAFPPQRRLG